MVVSADEDTLDVVDRELPLAAGEDAVDEFDLITTDPSVQLASLDDLVRVNGMNDQMRIVLQSTIEDLPKLVSKELTGAEDFPTGLTKAVGFFDVISTGLLETFRPVTCGYNVLHFYPFTTAIGVNSTIGVTKSACCSMTIEISLYAPGASSRSPLLFML